MIISEKQLLAMFQILADSAAVDITRVFTFDYKTRVDLYTTILNQQSTQLKEVVE